MFLWLIHGCVLRGNLEFELAVANSFIDTYVKSGNLLYAKAIFDGMPTKDIISWNTLISGSVLYGYPGAALNLFGQMREEGMKPNRGTFVSIISAYSLAKKVDEGEQVFSSMTQDFDILPCLDHCTAMIDLYSCKFFVKSFCIFLCLPKIYSFEFFPHASCQRSNVFLFQENMSP